MILNEFAVLGQQNQAIKYLFKNVGKLRPKRYKNVSNSKHLF